MRSVLPRTPTRTCASKLPRRRSTLLRSFGETHVTRPSNRQAYTVKLIQKSQTLLAPVVLVFAQLPHAGHSTTTPPSRVERDAPCYRVRPLGLRLPSKRASPFFGGYPSSNRTCSFPAYGSPCGTGFISFAPLRPSAPFHIDSDGCSSIWTSGFRRAAT